MNASLKWLKQYVDLTGDPDDMAEVLTVDGIPVEHVSYPGKDIKGVVTGKILSVEKHPDASHLVICQIDVGGEKNLQIVTGADNVRPGQVVPVAQHNSHIPGKHDPSAPGGTRMGGVKIKKSKLRGVLSEGMLCSIGELGLPADLYPDVNKEGILIMPEGTPIGHDIHEYFGLDDVIYEFELTANRPDCFSMIGLALESSAIFKAPLHLPEVKVAESGDPVQGRAEVALDDAKYCKRFCGRLLENVKIGPSPEWMHEALRSNGMRPINNVVDTANYVMLEFGQPLHTYDYDKVAGHKLLCRHAKTGETITTLDKEARKLETSDLVIADANGPVCIAGVMGGLDSEVTEKTTKVFLEAAVFDSASVRRTSRRLGLRSEASGRYEKGVNPVRTMEAMNRFCQLLEEQGAATVAPGVLDVYPVPAAPIVIHTSHDFINKYIGVSLSDETIDDILTRLHFKLDKKADGTMDVTVPDFRMDVSEAADLTEEVARLYGYANIPVTTPHSAIVKGVMSDTRKAVRIITDALIEDGLSEAVTFSFMDKGILSALGYPEGDKVFEAIPIINPISDEYPYVRTSLLPGLVKALKYNLAQKNDQTALFESGTVFHPKALPLTELPAEEMQISGLIAGQPEAKGYPNDQRGYDFFDVKGIMEDVMTALGIKDYDLRRSTSPIFHPGKSADFVKDGKVIASFGALHPLALDRCDLKKEVYAFILSLPALVPFYTEDMRYERIPRYPAAERDLAILVPETLTNAEVEAVIEKKGGHHLESLYLFDLYQGEQVPEGKKSMAYRLTFRKPEGTLTDGETDQYVKKIVEGLEAIDCHLRD